MGHIKRQYEVQSQSGARKSRVTGQVAPGPVKTYTVTEYTDGTWACACMNWTRTVPRQDCKHILTQQKLNSNGFVAPTVSGVRVAADATGRKFRD